MALPILTTIEDVRAVVSYLKSRPTGATLQEARAALKEQVLDPRKVRAYEVWGVISKEGDRMKLSPRGWDLARKPEAETHVYRMILNSTAPYKSAIEWAHYQSFETLTSVDVGAHWHEHHADEIGTRNETTIGYMAVCFFHLCQGAGLGRLVKGRWGLATRLLFDRAALREFVENAAPRIVIDEPEGRHAPADGNGGGPGVNNDADIVQKPLSHPHAERLRVFISHGRNMNIVNQIGTMLELADIESEVAEKEETAAIPVSEKVFTAMRRCNAGIIAVTTDESKKDKDGNYTLNENVLIEVGAAFVLYERRVVLLWDRRLPVPSNLQGLYRCEIEGIELSWSAGMKLMKTIQAFKEAAKDA